MAQVFDGITVLDFTSGRAGGVATMVLSDFGAEVIKIEPPGGEKFGTLPAPSNGTAARKASSSTSKPPTASERRKCWRDTPTLWLRTSAPASSNGWALTTTPSATAIPVWSTHP